MNNYLKNEECHFRKWYLTFLYLSRIIWKHGAQRLIVSNLIGMDLWIFLFFIYFVAFRAVITEQSSYCVSYDVINFFATHSRTMGYEIGWCYGMLFIFLTCSLFFCKSYFPLCLEIESFVNTWHPYSLMLYMTMRVLA